MMYRKPTTDRGDRELVEDALRDRNTFAAIVERYEALLRRYAMRLGIARHEDVDDVLQEAFIKIYINLNDFDKTLSFSAWIYRIVHNEVISHFRKQNVRPQIADSEAELELFEQIIDESNLEEEIDRRFAHAALRQALENLSSHYRDVLVLRFLEEKTYDEIADILQLPPGTVATYINRGKKELKITLKKFYQERI